jgi:hypothetical protein
MGSIERTAMDYSENEENTDILSIAQLVFGGCFNDCI